MNVWTNRDTDRQNLQTSRICGARPNYHFPSENKKNHVLQILQFNLPEFPNPHLLHFRCQNFVHNCYIHLKLSNFNDTLILAILASAPKTLNYASVDMKSMLNFKSIVHPSFPVVHSNGQMQE